MSLNLYQKEQLQRFDKKAKNIIIGIASGGDGEEYNQYLDEIDDEGEKFIKNFIKQYHKGLIKEIRKIIDDKELTTDNVGSILGVCEVNGWNMLIKELKKEIK